MLRKLNKWKCKRIEPLLWEYADGQITPEQKARVEAHLSHCAACQARLQTAARIGQGFAALRQARVPATQANWADVQARLAAAPVLSQSAVFGRKAPRYRVLMSAGTVAAITLLWFALVPRVSNQSNFIDQTSGNRFAKPNMSHPVLKTSLTDAAKRNDAITDEKSFLKVRTEEASPYGARPVAPDVRLANVSYDRLETTSGRLRAEREGKYVRKHHFARRQRFLLARNETMRPNQYAPASGVPAGMFAPAVGVALSFETPNYVLTGVDGEAEPAGRARISWIA